MGLWRGELSVDKKQADEGRALMVARVKTAYRQTVRLEEGLGVIANEVRGTGYWVAAYERVMDAKNTRVWLAGYLDALTQE